MKAQIMPPVKDQREGGYGIVVDPDHMKIPDRIPIWWGDGFNNPPIGWASNIHKDADGALVAELDLDPGYEGPFATYLNWETRTDIPTLWGMNVIRIPDVPDSHEH